MAKTEKQRSSDGGTGSRADQVRSAVDMAFQAAGAQLGRERAVDLADELASAAQRVREALEELRPPSVEDLKRLDQRLRAIERRLDALEGAAKPRNAARTATRGKPAARRAASPKPKPKPKPAVRGAAKPKPKPASRPAARKPASRSGS